MPISGPILAVAELISKAVFNDLIKATGLTDQVRKKLRLDATQNAYTAALAQSIYDFQQAHPEWYHSLFDASFFEHEGAQILAQFLVPNGIPDAAELTERWVRSLGIRHPDRAHELAWQCEPAAYEFLRLLGSHLKAQSALQDLTDSRNLDRLAGDMQRLLAAFEAEQATPITRRKYLHWLAENNLYLDPRGTLQTQRQVQLKLDEIYITLRAQIQHELDQADRLQLERKLEALELARAEGEISASELEDRIDLLEAEVTMRRTSPRHSGTSVDLETVVKEYPLLAILGDPGSGKTTLLKYLTLRNAQAMLSGRGVGDPIDGEAVNSVLPVHFPVLVRIADYAEEGRWQNGNLTDFLSQAFATYGECPARGLGDLLSHELARGGCLIMLDGLDEVVQADDRRGIVRKIEEFIRRHDQGGPRGPNRFIVTSRIAGYRSAPLGTSATHFVVEDMDTVQIRRFLERWCRAVEDAQTGSDLSEDARQATADAEVAAIMEAVETNSGVARLAANPLMLRTLALIHRTGMQIPQRRIELYKLAADTLARTWRVASGVPENALVDDRNLTRLLGKLAYWMHKNKPTGLATEREVYAVLGEEWARIKQLPWDGDEPQPEILRDIDDFLLRVREHTGLFVERAPQRYGFMHLTFEEYYTARHLVANARKRAALIRSHLHDPRWDEPILLALGFVGMDYADDAEELLRTAILAQGDEAVDQSVISSPYEEYLGRDHLFVFRCLADLLPIDPQTLTTHLARTVEDLLKPAGIASYHRYRLALNQILKTLSGTSFAEQLCYRLVVALGDEDVSVRAAAAESLGRLGEGNEEVIGALVTALRDDEGSVRAAAAQSLVRLGEGNEEVIGALVTALRDDDVWVSASAAQSLGRLGDQDKMTGVMICGLLSQRLGVAPHSDVQALLWKIVDSLTSKYGHAWYEPAE